MLHELLDSDLPPAELTVERLNQEANILIGAGSDTVKHTLAVATFYVLNDPDVHRRLYEELLTALPSHSTVLSLSDLEKLPYLTAVIQECESPTP